MSSKLDLVLNNGNVTENEVYEAKELLLEHNIEIDLVGITNDIFEIVQRVFTTKEVVWSLHCNSIREHITNYSPIVKTVFENRATFIIKV